MKKAKGLGMLTLPGQLTHRIVTVAIVIVCVIVVVGLVAYYYVATELAITKIDQTYEEGGEKR